MEQWPSWISGVVVCVYWVYVVRMLIRQSRKRRGMAKRIVLPTLRSEQIMWLIWVPLIFAWIAMPFVAVNQPSDRYPWLALPAFATARTGFAVLRWLAAAGAVAAFIASLICWRYMGRNWRIAIDENLKDSLLVAGPFALVRHPIYTLSISLMLMTLLSTPTPIMGIIAAVHVLLMNIKARNEERFMLDTHGQSYREYCRRTGRFFPRLG